ncbi:MAG: sialate O-acetylesterase [Bryobacteraceae bacterium]
MQFLLLAFAAAAAFAQERVSIRSSLDGAEQPALAEIPAGAGPVPLLVHLHSWSATFDKSSDIELAVAEARKRGWAFVSPNFRGPNETPEACGSDLAVQDVLDSVAYMKSRAKIDERRIYVMGSSGGGYMTLVMAARAPHVWAAASSWVPISDLPAWYDFSKSKNSRYWKMMEGCFGSGPHAGFPVQQYLQRSPIHFLRLAQGLPLDINTGIQDGHTGSVPVSHSIRAFNVLAPAARRVSDADIEDMVREAKIPARLAAEKETEERKRPILFRRSAGSVRLTVFDAGHEGDFPTAIRWLERHVRPVGVMDLSLQDNQVLQRDASGHAKVPVPAGVEVETRINSGPWTRGAATLATGGPYTVEYKLPGGTVARRSNIFVGDLWILAGQSNMVGRAPVTEITAPDPMVQMMTPADTWELAREPLHERITRDGREIGAGLGLAFAKEMVRRTRVPIGLIPTAVGGTSLEQWDPAHAPKQFRRCLYGNFVARAKLAGGRVKGVLWYQGEADASKMDTASTYLARFRALVEAMRSDLGQPDLPVYSAQLSRHVAAESEGWNVVQEAQRKAELEIPHTGMVAGIDLTLTDPIHLDGPSLQTLGRRFATRVLDGPAPRLESATWDNQFQLRLHFSSKLRADGVIRGFELNLPAAYHAWFDPKNGDVLIGVRVPASASKLELWYGRGLNPVCNVRDARGLALPVFGPYELPLPKELAK